MRKWIMVDVEADGPCPDLYSMISFGAVVVDKNLDKTFFGKCSPISSIWIEDALKVSGYTRKEVLDFPNPSITMSNFKYWIEDQGITKPMFISDNNGFDWQFINYYFWNFLSKNPFGHSSTNLGSLYKGMTKNVRDNFKHLRKTKHTHNPVDDAIGNAEALLYMKEKMGLKIEL